MQYTALSRAGPPSGGFVTTGTLVIAAVSAVLLTLMSGCHSGPGANGFAASSTDKAAEARLRAPGSMPHLQAFDEQFYVADAEAP